MRELWHRLRNELALRSAYRDVNNLTGDDLANEQFFAPLRQFAAAPAKPSAIPVGLLQEFNASQRRMKGHKKFRYGAGGLFAAIILFPGLAWAGVLPPSVARVVQQVFNVVSLPIHIPSAESHAANDKSGPATTPSASTSTTSPAAPTSQSNSPSATPETSTLPSSAPAPVPSTHEPSAPTTTKPGIAGGSESSDDNGSSTSAGSGVEGDMTGSGGEGSSSTPTPEPSPSSSSSATAGGDSESE